MNSNTHHQQQPSSFEHSISSHHHHHQQQQQQQQQQQHTQSDYLDSSMRGSVHSSHHMPIGVATSQHLTTSPHNVQYAPTQVKLEPQHVSPMQQHQLQPHHDSLLYPQQQQQQFGPTQTPLESSGASAQNPQPSSSNPPGRVTRQRQRLPSSNTSHQSSHAQQPQPQQQQLAQPHHLSPIQSSHQQPHLHNQPQAPPSQQQLQHPSQMASMDDPMHAHHPNTIHPQDPMAAGMGAASMPPMSLHPSSHSIHSAIAPSHHTHQMTSPPFPSIASFHQQSHPQYITGHPGAVSDPHVSGITPQQTNPHSSPDIVPSVEPSHICPVCHDAFGDEQSLARHAARSHARRSNSQFQEPLQCSECPAKLANPQNMRRHMAVCHSGDRTGPLRRGSAGVAKAQTPSRKLKNTKVFVCELCPTGTTFRWKGNLKRHHQLIHLQAKPFKCQVCNESFGTKSNREVHMIVHLPEKRELAGSRGGNNVGAGSSGGRSQHGLNMMVGQASNPIPGQPGSVGMASHIPGIPQAIPALPNLHNMSIGSMQGHVQHPGHQQMPEHQYDR